MSTLVRAVANKVVDVRDHKVTVYDGGYDYFLFTCRASNSSSSGGDVEQDRPRMELRCARAVKSVAQRQVKLQDLLKNVKTKEQRRAEAEDAIVEVARSERPRSA